MCSVTAMRPVQHRAIADAPRPKWLLSRAISAPTASWPFASPFQCGCGRPRRLRTATYQRLRWSAWVWSPPPESNRRPHPYHGTTRNRCADHRFPRSRPTVRAEVIGSPSTKLCAHFPHDVRDCRTIPTSDQRSQSVPLPRSALTLGGSCQSSAQYGSSSHRVAAASAASGSPRR